MERRRGMKEVGGVGKGKEKREERKRIRSKPCWKQRGKLGTLTEGP
jgi:hypothetical protein